MRILLTILLCALGFMVNSQTRPSGFPAQKTTTWHQFGYLGSDSGTISARRDTLGFLPRFSGTMVMRPQDRRLYFYDSVALQWYRISFDGTPAASVAWGTITGTLASQTDLQNALNLKLNISDTLGMLLPYLRKVDTTNKWITSLFRRQDSVFYVKGGAAIFSYKDSIGSGTSLTNLGDGYRLLVPNSGIKTLEVAGPWFFLDTTSYTDKIRLGADPQVGFGLNLTFPTDAIYVDTARGVGLPTYFYVDSSVASIPAGGINNTNIGLGFRVLSDPSAQTLRTFFTDNTLTLDTTSNSGGITGKVDTSRIATQYDLTQVTAQGNAGGDLSGTYPNPRLAHTMLGTGVFGQFKNSFVVGDTIARLGQIFNDNFARASLGANYGTAGTQTVSFPGSAYMQLAGGLNYDNNVYRTDYTAVNRWIDSVRFVTGTITGTSYGLIVNVYDPSGYATGIRVQFGCATALTNIFFRFYDGTQLGLASASLTISAGDSLLAIVERRDNVFICTYRNITTSTEVTLTHTFSTLTSAAQPAPATARMAIGSLGGTQNVSYWSHTSSEVKNQFAEAGNSIASGGYTATIMGNSWPNKVFYTRDQWARLGGAGDRSSDAINYIPQLVALSPRIIYYCLGVNDALNAVTGATYSANVQQFLDSCAAHNITPILVELPPNNTVLTKPYSDTLAAIALRRGLVYVTGIYNALRTGTAYNATYSSDGVHPNNAGHLIIANLVKAQSASSYYNLTTLNIPADSTANSRMLQIEEDGHHTVGVFANTIQIIGNPIRVNDQILLPSGTTPAASLTISSANGFVNIIRNTSSSGWSGDLIYNSANAFVAGYGWQNALVTSGNGAISDSTYMFKTYNRTTGRFAFFAGDNQASNAYADLLIFRGSILPGSHVAAGRTINPEAGMFYWDRDSSDYVYFTGTAWRKYSSLAPGTAPALASTFIGVGSGGGLLSGSSAFTFDGTTVKQENALGAYSGTSTTTLGATSGFDFRGFAKATPTAADQVLARFSAGTLDGGTTENITARIEAVSNAAHTPGVSEQTRWDFYVSAAATQIRTLQLLHNGRLLLGGTATTTGIINFPASSTAAPAAVFPSGTFATTPISGGLEYNGTSWGFTVGSTRKNAAMFTAATPSNGALLQGNATDFTLLSIGTANQLLRVNAGATAAEWFTPTYVTSNIYTADGFLSGNRTLDGAEVYDLYFSNLDTFYVSSLGKILMDGTFKINQALEESIEVSAAGTLSMTTKINYVASGTTATFSLPIGAAGLVGRVYRVKNRGSGNVTIDVADASSTIYDTGAVSSIVVVPGASRSFIWDGSFWNLY